MCFTYRRLRLRHGTTLHRGEQIPTTELRAAPQYLWVGQLTPQPIKMKKTNIISKEMAKEIGQLLNENSKMCNYRKEITKVRTFLWLPSAHKCAEGLLGAKERV